MIGKQIALIQVPNQRLFSMQAAAQYLGRDPKTLRKWTVLGLLPAKNIEGRRAYTLEALDGFIDDHPDWVDNPARRKSASALPLKETHA